MPRAFSKALSLYVSLIWSMGTSDTRLTLKRTGCLLAQFPRSFSDSVKNDSRFTADIMRCSSRNLARLHINESNQDNIPQKTSIVANQRFRIVPMRREEKCDI